MMPQPIEQKVRQLDNDVHAIYEMLATIDLTQRRHTNRFAELQADVNELNGTVGALGSTVESMTVRLGSLETTVGSLQTKVDSLETTVGSLQTKVDSLETKIDKVLALLQR